MYTVKEAAEILGLNPHTVRYYANMDLVPTLKRDQNGNRLFDEDGITYLQGVVFLRNCGMSIDGIREYFDLIRQGDSTLPERYHMILEQRENVDRQIEKLRESRRYVEKKLELYFSQMQGRPPGQGPDGPRPDLSGTAKDEPTSS